MFLTMIQISHAIIWVLGCKWLVWMGNGSVTSVEWIYTLRCRNNSWNNNKCLTVITIPPDHDAGCFAEVDSNIHLNFEINTRSGELRTQKLKSHLLRTQSLKVLPLKPGVGQYIAMHATLTARDFFLANFYFFGPFNCIFFQNFTWVFPVIAMANTSSCVGLQNKMGHPAGCRFPQNMLLFFWFCALKL